MTDQNFIIRTQWLFLLNYKSAKFPREEDGFKEVAFIEAQ
jgi:hypothetical protein